MHTITRDIHEAENVLSLERAKTDTQTDRAQGFAWKKQRAKTQQQEKKGEKTNQFCKAHHLSGVLSIHHQILHNQHFHLPS
jgi:hypothetical protein